ncbi:MAG TPA: CBS domain-containing protein [Desulfobacteraceae bacterium]|nr:CBS domain-containing protein [Desulfobacteraceae bacterium]
MEQDKAKIIRVRDVMHKGIISIDGMATTREAVKKMKENNVFSLLVNKRDENDAWGILVSQDIVKDAILPGRSLDEVNVYEVMTKPVITVPAAMDIRYAVRLIYRAGIRRAPVEDKGELVGMISLVSLILDEKLF